MIWLEYCTTCGQPVEGEPLIPDRGMRLCWPCAEAVLSPSPERLALVGDYVTGELDRETREDAEQARLEAEAILDEHPEWRERHQRARLRMKAA